MIYVTYMLNLIIVSIKYINFHFIIYIQAVNCKFIAKLISIFRDLINSTVDSKWTKI